jgi:hypothetical protein
MRPNHTSEVVRQLFGVELLIAGSGGFCECEFDVTMLFHVLVLLEFNWLIDRSESPTLRLCPASNGTTRVFPPTTSTLLFQASRHNVQALLRPLEKQTS